jgi:hypothetical protein
MNLFRLLVIAAVIYFFYRLVRFGSAVPGGGRDRRSIQGHARRSVRTGRIQCPWCDSWNVTTYRDVKAPALFLALLSLGVILLFTPLFPRVNKCENCGRRWQFSDRR